MESLDRICFEVLRDTMHMQKDMPYGFVNKTLNVYVFFYTNHLHFYIYSYKPNLIPRFVPAHPSLQGKRSGNEVSYTDRQKY